MGLSPVPKPVPDGAGLHLLAAIDAGVVLDCAGAWNRSLAGTELWVALDRIALVCAGCPYARNASVDRSPVRGVPGFAEIIIGRGRHARLAVADRIPVFAAASGALERAPATRAFAMAGTRPRGFDHHVPNVFKDLGTLAGHPR